jgi:hypothetical protein
MISKESVDLIYEVTRIEEVIQDFVALKKRGVNFLGLCPFHEERTPSFTVSPVKGIYKCFGCGKGGNAVNFLMEHKKMQFNDALVYLAEKYHITIQKIESEVNKDQKERKQKNILSDILAEEIYNFTENSSSVFKLMEFDSMVLNYCINNIEDLNYRIKNNKEIKITSPLLTADSTLKALKNINDNASMKIQYNAIYNQCLVLLVSYFSSSVKELFKKSVQFLIDNDIPFLGNLKSDIKLNFEELENSKFNLKKCIVDLVIEKKNISFQDMKSIARSFKEYFDITIEQNNDVDNIILGLASRHTIVHNLSQSDQKFMNQVSFAKRRNIKTGIKLYDSIVFNQDEIKIVNSSMIKYLTNITTNINRKFK